MAGKKCWPAEAVRARRRLLGSWRKYLTWEAMGSHLPTVDFGRGHWICFYQPCHLHFRYSCLVFTYMVFVCTVFRFSHAFLTLQSRCYVQVLKILCPTKCYHICLKVPESNQTELEWRHRDPAESGPELLGSYRTSSKEFWLGEGGGRRFPRGDRLP